jgi:hypothetical protein
VANENEFRLAKVFSAEVGDVDGQRKIKIPAVAIKAVYAGPRIKAADMEALKNIISGINPSPDFYQMKDAGSICARSCKQMITH